MYHVFTRNFWKPNPRWPDGREPNPRARKTTVGYFDTEEEAQARCHEINKAGDAGKLSKKAEYTRV